MRPWLPMLCVLLLLSACAPAFTGEDAPPVAARVRILNLPVTYYANQHDPTRPTFETHPLNIRLFTAIYQARHPLLDVWCSYMLWLGKGWVLAPIALLLFFLRRRVLLPLLAAVAVETLLVQVVKQLASQPRPGIVLADVTPLERVYHNAFPSGDTAMACALGAVLFPLAPTWGRLALLTYVAFIAYERIYVGAHFPLDVLTGAVIGVASGVAAWWWLGREKAIV